MALRITTLAERPEFTESMGAMADSWPEFMLNDPIADFYYTVCARLLPDHILVADDDAEPGKVVARGFSTPFALSGGKLPGELTGDRRPATPPGGRQPEVPPGGKGAGVLGGGEAAGRELPDDGWDGVIRRGWLARERGVKADRVSALEITIRRDLLGRGLSGLMLDAMRQNAARLGFRELVAPVRPNLKHLEPRTPMADYAFRTRDDGLPYDPWLRVHVRAGGRIVKVAPRSMTVSGTLAEWRGWTGLAFDAPGPVEVPGALSPVHVDLDQDHAVYVEPNVWVVHPLQA